MWPRWLQIRGTTQVNAANATNIEQKEDNQNKVWTCEFRKTWITISFWQVKGIGRTEGPPFASILAADFSVGESCTSGPLPWTNYTHIVNDDLMIFYESTNRSESIFSDSWPPAKERLQWRQTVEECCLGMSWNQAQGLSICACQVRINRNSLDPNFRFNDRPDGSLPQETQDRLYRPQTAQQSDQYVLWQAKA